MTCKIDDHPLVDVINERLRSGSSFGEIRSLCLQEECWIPTQATLSRHLKHLGLPSRGVRKATSELPRDAGAEEDTVPDISELRNLALKEFYTRLKHNPKSVQTRELVPILTQILRIEGAQKPKDLMDDLLSQLNDG